MHSTGSPGPTRLLATVTQQDGPVSFSLCRKLTTLEKAY